MYIYNYACIFISVFVHILEPNTRNKALIYIISNNGNWKQIKWLTVKKN